MRLKLYRAPSVSEAMARMRAELGGDALILSTRRVADGVELTAALEPEEPSPSHDPALARALGWHGVPNGLADQLDAGPLEASLSRVLRFTALPLTPGATPLLLAGPPGQAKRSPQHG